VKVPSGTPLDQPAFSNSTEFYAWSASWCERCVHDKPAREGRYEDACQIVMLAFMDQTPAEWIRQEGSRLGDKYHCIEFRSEDDGPPPPTEPEPVPPGQGELFSGEPYVGTRMLADSVLRPADVEVP
jgi:hypothetical protein